jgi:DNA N-6-adenine-methyltransferase (Dam)
MKSNEWYTPSKYVEAAREVMGTIDLDPASCALANETVRATRYYTQEDDGLTKEWHGNVWLNPPFNRLHQSEVGRSSIIQFWIQHLLKEYQHKRVRQAILLFPLRLETQWFQLLWPFPHCFPKGRIIFDQPQGRKESPPFGSGFSYLGPHEERFTRVFSHFGTIARRLEVSA